MYLLLLWTLSVIVGCYIIYKLIQTIKFVKALDKIPGPKGYPLIGNIVELFCPPEVLFEKLYEYGKQYYPVYRLKAGVNAAVFLKHPEDIEMVISSMKNIPKSDMYRCLHPWLNTGLLTSEDIKWQSRRKILTPAFHFNILQQFTTVFIEESEKLVARINDMINQPIDVVPLVTGFTLNSICETAMGASEIFSKGQDKYRDAIYKMGELTIYRVIRPWFHNEVLYIFSTKFYETLSVAKKLHSFSDQIIKERKKNFKIIEMPKNEHDVYKSKKRLAMLDLLLNAKAEGAHIDDNGIREEVDTFMFEGHDTTSMCISFTLMLLACNKDVQDKVVEELRDIFEDDDRSVTYEDLNKMKYLERVLKESLRLYPSVPMIGRISTEDITTKSGHFIPKGTNVMVRIYDLHHDPNVYPDPEKFDPDRFLLQNIGNKHPYAYLPFSAGPRNCIGQKFALFELKTILASILRKFELKPVDTPATIILLTDLILHSKNGIRVTFTPREHF